MRAAHYDVIIIGTVPAPWCSLSSHRRSSALSILMIDQERSVPAVAQRLQTELHLPYRFASRN